MSDSTGPEPSIPEYEHNNASPKLHWEGERAPLAKALVAVAAKIPAVGRDKANPLLHNKYVTLDALRDTITPILAAHGLCIMQVSDPSLDRTVKIAATQKVEAREGSAGMVSVQTTVLHESGSCVWFETHIPWQEAAGITTAQAVGIGMTYGERYAFRGFFSVAATDDTDTDGAPVNQRDSGPSEEDIRALQTWMDRWSNVESPEDYKSACEDWKGAPSVAKGDEELKGAMLDANKRASAAARKRKEEKAKDSDEKSAAPDLEAKVDEYVTLYKSCTGKKKLAELDAQLLKEHAAVRNASAVMAAQADAVARVTGGAA